MTRRELATMREAAHKAVDVYFDAIEAAMPRCGAGRRPIKPPTDVSPEALAAAHAILDKAGL